MQEAPSGEKGADAAAIAVRRHVHVTALLPREPRCPRTFSLRDRRLTFALVCRFVPEVSAGGCALAEEVEEGLQVADGNE